MVEVSCKPSRRREDAGDEKVLSLKEFESLAERLRTKTVWCASITLAGLIGCCALCPYLASKGGPALQIILLTSHWDSADVVLGAYPSAFAAAAVFIGLGGWALGVLWLTPRFVYREAWPDYLVYARVCHGTTPESIRLIRALSVCLVVVSVLAFALALDWYTVLSADGMVVDPYPCVQARLYVWQSIRAIQYSDFVTTGAGTTIYAPHYSVIFSDGNSWSTRIWYTGVTMRSPEWNNVRDTIGLISSRSGVPVDSRWHPTQGSSANSVEFGDRL
jgi:hypothetical protein